MNNEGLNDKIKKLLTGHTPNKDMQQTVGDSVEQEPSNTSYYAKLFGYVALMILGVVMPSIISPLSPILLVGFVTSFLVGLFGFVRTFLGGGSSSSIGDQLLESINTFVRDFRELGVNVEATFASHDEITQLLTEAHQSDIYKDRSFETLIALLMDGKGQDVIRKFNEESYYSKIQLALLKGSLDFTLLHYVVKSSIRSDDMAHIVTLLVVNGADVNAQNTAGITPLMLAVQKGDKQVVSRLLELGADPTNIKAVASGRDSREPGVDVEATFASHDEITQLLTEAHQSDIYKDRSFETLIALLMDGKGQDVIRKFNEESYYSKIQLALLKGSLDFTLLHYVVKSSIRSDDMAHIVKLLVDKGADVNAQNTAGITPLMLAVQKGDKQVVSRLLELGADPTNIKAVASSQGPGSST